MEQINRDLEDPALWDDQKRAGSLGRERARLESVIQTLEGLGRTLSESAELLALAVDEDDQATADEIAALAQ